MHRVTITIDDDLDTELDGFMKTRGYDNRSEAIRDLAMGRQRIALEALQMPEHQRAWPWVTPPRAALMPGRAGRD